MYPLVYAHVLLFGHLVSTHPHSSTCTYVNLSVLCSEQTSSTFSMWLFFSWQQMHLCSISLFSKEYLQKWDLHISLPVVFFLKQSVFPTLNGSASNEQRNKIYYLFLCLYITSFPQDATSHAGPDPLKSVRKIPKTWGIWGLHTLWQHLNNSCRWDQRTGKNSIKAQSHEKKWVRTEN